MTAFHMTAIDPGTLSATLLAPGAGRRSPSRAHWFYLGLSCAVALVGAGVWLFGVAVLSMAALSLVPVMFAMLIVISRG